MPSFSRAAHAALAAAVFAALTALAPAPARASGAGFSIDGDAAAAVLIATSASVFGVTDLIFMASDRPMPLWLSIMQLSIAGALIPYMALSSAESYGPKIAAGATALLFSAYAIYDIARYPAYRRQKLREREIERQRELCGVAIEARPQGGLLHVYGRL